MSSQVNLTDTEAAKRLRVKTKTLANWRSDNKGPAFLKVGGRVLYPLNDLIAYEQQSRQTTRDAA